MTMKFTLTLLSIFGFLVSPLAFALEASTTPLPYTDGPFDPATEAGVRVLTDLGAVEGNPDGSFAPYRTLNRAEFVKIVLLSMTAIEGDVFEPKSCFPDVNEEDWYSVYVCYAAENNVVDGYPDGLFRPANPVNYAEALKILGELYQVEFATTGSAQWYQGYADAAIALGVALPTPPAYDAYLTRGQMARLAAAYYANAQGQLAEYRALEKGQTMSSSSSSSSQTSNSFSSSSSDSSSSSESSSSSTPEVENSFNVQSHLLLPNTTTPPVVGGIFTSESDAHLRIVSVRFDRELRSVKTFEVRLSDGTVLGTMILEPNDSEDKTWRAEFTDALTLQADEPVVLYLHAVMNSTDQLFQSAERIEPRSFRIIVQDAVTNASIELLGGQPPFPIHNAVLNTIVHMESADPASGTVAPGDDRELGTFALLPHDDEEILQVKEILFALQKTDDVSLSDVQLSKAELPGLSNSCGVQPGVIRCTVLDERLQNVNAEEHYVLTATVEKSGEATGSLQLSIVDHGSPTSLGSIRYFDGANTFTWLNPEVELYTGTQWSVE